MIEAKQLAIEIQSLGLRAYKMNLGHIDSQIETYYYFYNLY